MGPYFGGVGTGLASRGVWEGGHKLLRALYSWRFAQLFGSEAGRGGFHLAYASLTPPVAQTDDGRPVRHILTRCDLPNVQFSMSAAVSSGGFDEWGTSGAAWYLTRNWRAIPRAFRHRPFATFVRVKRTEDKSAESIMQVGTPEEIERHARGN